MRSILFPQSQVYATSLAPLLLIVIHASVAAPKGKVRTVGRLVGDDLTPGKLANGEKTGVGAINLVFEALFPVKKKVDDHDQSLGS